MTVLPPWQLTVIVQDHYFPAGEVDSAPITVAEWQAWGQVWLQQLDPSLARRDCELSLRLTGDRPIQALNAQYRHQDQPTDVLAFAALEAEGPELSPDGEPLYLGDLVISVETAARQAVAQGWSLREELAWLASHGFLHLLGWDHPDESTLGAMLTRQGQLLKAVGFARGDRPEG